MVSLCVVNELYLRCELCMCVCVSNECCTCVKGVTCAVCVVYVWCAVVYKQHICFGFVTCGV